MDELTFRIRFDRSRDLHSDLMRQILASVEVRDLLIEDEPIEEIIKRIYAGAALQEVVGLAWLPGRNPRALSRILAHRLRQHPGLPSALLHRHHHLLAERHRLLLHLVARCYGPAAKTGVVHRGIQPPADAHLRVGGLDHPVLLLEHHRPGDGLRGPRGQDRHGADQAGLGARDVACARGWRIGVSPDAAYSARRPP